MDTSKKYTVSFKKSAVKELKALSKKDLHRIIKRIQFLENDPRSAQSNKLNGEEKYRIRQGDYRIVYGIDDKEHAVHIVKIGHRKDVYAS